MTENENRPIRISIDEQQGFGMFLMVVLHHEKWTTFGDFHLRFLRRVPVSDKQCTARTFATASNSGTNSIQDNGSSTDNAMADRVVKRQRVADWIVNTSASLPSQTPPRLPYYDADDIPLVSQAKASEADDDTTEDEDHRGIGAASLRKIWDGTILP